MALRFFIRLIYKLGLNNLIHFSLIFLAMASVAFGLAAINQAVSGRELLSVVFYGLLLAWILAGTRLKGWLAGGLLLLIGGGLIFVSVAELWNPLWALIKAANFQLAIWLGWADPLTNNPEIWQFALTDVSGRVANFASLIWEWLLAIPTGLPFYSQLAVNFIWGWLIWGLAAWAGWFYRRQRRPFVSILPGGVLLASGLSYSWAETNALAPFLFAILLLLAFNNYDLSERRWKTAKMDFPEDLFKEFSVYALVITTGLVLIAILLPQLTLENLNKFAQTFTHDPIEDAEPVIQSLGVRKKPIERSGLGNALSGGLPRRHLLGTGPELSEEIVMTVQVSGIQLEDQRLNQANLPLYWRSLTYQEYTGIGWRSPEFVLRDYKAGREAIAPLSYHHNLIQQDFRMANPQNRNLYASGDIVTVDHPFQIAWLTTIRLTDIYEAPGEFFGASVAESAYSVQSLIPVVSEAELRTTSGEYPGWITDRYLALPESLPNRVRSLAQELTATDLNSYDQARSLETYLRTFDYTLDLELPPLDRDMVDYFLFSLQKGYCDYYASSMVVMARSLGIPARMVIGYYRGEYDAVNDRYIVTEADAHSWVEIYFQDIGWIPFEPTAGRAPLAHVTGELAQSAPGLTAASLPNLTPWYARIPWNWQNIMMMVGVAAILILLGWVGFDHWQLTRLAPQPTVAIIYQRLYRHGRRLGIVTTKESTPLEFSRALIQRLARLSTAPFWHKRLHPAVDDIDKLTRIYIQLLYSPVQFTLQERNQAIRLWRSLRRRLWIARLRQRTQPKKQIAD